MPVAQDWISSPLLTVSSMFDMRDQGQDWEKKVSDFFKDQLIPDKWSHVTSLNDVANQDLKDGQLVRFRCMIQDMFDPEFYLAEYQVKSLVDGTVRTVSGRYRDTLVCGPREEVVDDESNLMSRTKDRLSYYCVSIPGEAGWVTDQFRSSSCVSTNSQPGPSGTNSLKRSLDTDEDSMETEETVAADILANDTENKKLKSDDGHQTVNNNKIVDTVIKENKLNQPLGDKNKAAIIKMYDLAESEIKLNDMLEVVGIVSLDPVLATMEDDMDGVGPNLPPPSLVPRLHVVTFSRLEQDSPRKDLNMSIPEMTSTRSELLAILTQSMLGDKLAAEYLLCHLISKIYLRKDVLVLGKLSLNLHNMTQHDSWPRRLSTILGLLTTNSNYLSLTRETLDSTDFIPKKDFEANRLVPGLLQLPAGCHLFINETVMTDGQLGPTGLKNLTALGNLITWQRVEYDFKYQKMEYECDVPCLLMSEGRSMLPSDSQLMVKPDCAASPDVISTNFKGVGQYLTSSLLDRIRTYIAVCKRTEFNLTEEATKSVQDDFVAMRQQEGGMTVEEFHSMLVLARLVAISNSHNSLDQADWNQAKVMEKERKERASALPSRAGVQSANGMPMHLGQS